MRADSNSTASRTSARCRARPGRYPALDAAEAPYARLTRVAAAPRVHTQLGTLPLAVVRPLLTDPATPSAVVDGIWRTLIGRARGQGGEWILVAVGCAVPKL